MVWAILIALLIGLDQASKIFIYAERVSFEHMEIIKDFFYLTYLENRGAAFSMLQNFRPFFLIMTPIAVGVMIYFFQRQKHGLARIALCLLIAGALGNFIDRLLRGFVVDFFHFYPFGYDFAVFNVADIFVSVGVALLVIYILFIYKEPVHKVSAPIKDKPPKGAFH